MDEAVNHSGPMYNCAEAIILAVDEEYKLNLPEEVVKSVAGFGGGMGAGSTCGYLTGAISALSLIFGPEAALWHYGSCRNMCSLCRKF